MLVACESVTETTLEACGEIHIIGRLQQIASHREADVGVATRFAGRQMAFDVEPLGGFEIAVEQSVELALVEMELLGHAVLPLMTPDAMA